MRVSATTPITVIGCLVVRNEVGYLRSQWVLAGKPLARGPLRDQRHIGIGTVGGSEVASGNQRNSAWSADSPD